MFSRVSSRPKAFFSLFCSFSVLSTPAINPSVSKPILHGIRVLDLSRILAGPYCCQLLGDLGAEIIKIEEPVQGDDSRSWNPPEYKNISTYFISCNRNKKSIGINLKSNKGVELVKELVAISDVIVENFVPGKLNKLGLGYETLSKINNKLIYANVSGYGDSGDYATKPGYDVMASALGGLINITGSPSEPAKVGVAITDITTGIHTYAAILAALYHRNKTNQGQYISTSLLNTCVANLINIGQNYLSCGLEGKRHGTAHESIVPYQSFQCKNQVFICTGALNDRQFIRLCEVLQLNSLPQDSGFQTNPARVKNRIVLLDLLTKKFLEKTSEEWLTLLEQAQIPCAPVNNLNAVFQDKQVLHNEMVETIEGFPLLSHPVKYSVNPAKITLPPPYLSQHSKQILHDLLGYSDKEIEQFHQEKVIGLPRE